MKQKCAQILVVALTVLLFTSSTYAAIDTGSVWTNGSNSYGTHGAGTTDNNINLFAEQLKNLGGIVDVAFGTFTGYALRSDGTVWSWGQNQMGQLGIGTSDYSAHPDPAQIPGLTNVIAISAGGYHAFAITANGTVYAWGNNDNGVLGIGTADTSPHPTPAAVSGVGSIVAIATSDYHTIALRNDGYMWGWGANTYGQLGGYGNCATPATQFSSPTWIYNCNSSTFPSGMVAVAAGTMHSMSLSSNGEVYAWGFNNWGMLGDGGTTQRNYPDKVRISATPTYLSGATAISAGWHHSVALRNSGEIWGWGDNDAGQLAQGTSSQGVKPFALYVSKPQYGYIEQTMLTVSASNEHTVGVRNDGRVISAGSFQYGQVGRNDLERYFLPVYDLNMQNNITTAVAGTSVTSAIRSPWQKAIIDASPATTGQYASIAMDSQDFAHVSYYDPVAMKLMYTTNRPTGSWSTPVVVDNGTDTGSYSSIAVDSSWHIHISYISNPGQYLKYANKVEASDGSGTWQTYSIDMPAYAAHTSIAVESSGLVHIAYYDQSVRNDLKHTSGSVALGWTTTVVDSSNDVGQYASLAIDGLNAPHIAYFDATNGDLKYATRPATTWVVSTVDTGGIVGQYASIAVDKGNKAHISYYDATNTSLKYATNAVVTAGGWYSMMLDNTGSAGTHTSIAVDALQRPHISYFAAGDKGGSAITELRYATKDAAGSWRLSVVEREPALYTGLKLDSLSRVHMVYYSSGVGACYVSNRDLGKPTGTILYNNGAQYANSRNITLNLTCNDGTGLGCRLMEFSPNGSTWSTPEPFAATKAYYLSPAQYAGDGTKLIFVRFTDHAGNVSSTFWENSPYIILDTTPPTANSICVNGCASYTNSAYVSVSVPATDPSGVTQIMLSNDGSFSSAWPQTYYSSVGWWLDSAEGTKNVFTKVMDKAGNWTEALAGTITLDVQPPSIGSVAITSKVNGITKSPIVNLSVNCSDALSGCGRVELSNDTLSWVSYYPEYPASINAWNLQYGAIGDGTKTVYARFYDRAGNMTAFEIKDTVILDTTAAVGSLTINGGAAYTKAPFAELELTCSDPAGTGCSQVQFSTDGRRWSAPETFNPVSPVNRAFALSESNELWLWGSNWYGALGDGSTSPSYKTLRLAEPDAGWLTMAEGAFHSVAIRSDGTLWAWGNNEYGQLGIGDVDSNPHNKPLQIGTDSDWATVGAGLYHSLAVKTDGSLWAWGYNGSGQLGIENTKPQSTPTRVGEEYSWLVASGGSQHTVAMKNDGTLWVWGDGTKGQLGTESTGSTTPDLYPLLSGATWKAFKAGQDHTVAIRSDGTLWAWGDNSSGQLGHGGEIVYGEYDYQPRQIGSDNSWLTVTAGYWHSAAIKANGTLWAWGQNAYGQLGIGGTTDLSSPQQVGSASDWARVTGGYLHTLGIKSDGTLLAWGYNDEGSLGTGDMIWYDTPHPVASDDSRWMAAEAGLSSAGLKLVDGPKTVYARFKDNAGNWSDAYKATIVYDGSPPTGSIAINNRAVFSPSTTVDLAITCLDTISGCSQMCISNTPSCSSWEPFTTLKSNWSLLAGDGPKTVYAWFRDNALDETAAGAPDMASIRLDTLPPAGTVQINGGALFSRNDFVTLDVTCSDGGTWSGCAAMSISNDGISWSQPEAITENVAVSKAWQLSPGDGLKKVYVKLKDTAGNWTSVVSLSGVPQAAITLDTTPPATPIVSGTTPTNAARPTWTWSHDSTGNMTYRYSLDSTNTQTGTFTVLTSYTPDTNLPDGLHTLYVSELDAAGNLSPAGFKAILIDTLPPQAPVVTGISPVNNAKPSWTWSSGGGGGNGSYLCKLDSQDFTSPTASGAITGYTSTTSLGEGAHTLYVKELDAAGNISASGQFQIIVDTGAPVTGISPDPGTYNTFQTVTLTCNDGAGNGINCSTYYSTDGTPPTTLYSGPIPIPKNLTLKFYSIDGLGNKEGDRSAIFNYNQGMTRLSLEMSHPTIPHNGSITLWGRLENMTANNADPTGEKISITITAPDGSKATQTATIYDPLGLYQLNNISGFSQRGVYTLKAAFAGSNLLSPSASTASTLLVGASAGYAILVEGKISGQEGLASHNKTANRIYSKLKSRGFEDDNIYYFNYDIGQAGVDAIPSEVAIQNVIETWAKSRMNGTPAPLYIIMVDHGSNNAFHINGETITPTKLNTWLTNLEHPTNGLNAAARLEKRFIIMGSCYSGSFIPALSQAPAAGNGGRVIITSAAADEVSYKGPQEPNDGIRSGEYFLEEFFTQLERGYSFRQSFVEATALTRTYTQKGGTSTNSNAPYYDGAVQHPMLDDNGDGIGSTTFIDGALQDGDATKNMTLGAGVSYSTNSASNPADITQVSDTIYLGSSEISANLWAKVNDDTQVDSAVWLEIRNLSTPLAATGGSEQAELITARIPMLHNPLTNQWERDPADVNLGTSRYPFTGSGTYEIFYFVRDIDTLKLAPMKRSVVYKAKTASDPLPGPFHLLSPTNGGTESNMVVFSWDPASSPNPLTYTLLVSSSPDFSANHIIYHQEEIANTMVALGPDKLALVDNSNYYWKVQATDVYGARRWSEELDRYFHTDFQSNGLPGIIQGYVRDSFGNPIVDAIVTAGSTSFPSKDPTGAFALAVSGGTSYTLNASKGGYSSTGSLVSVASGGTLNTIITMSDMQAPTVTAFSVPPAANSLTVTISALTASDNSKTIASYCITETGSAAGCLWGTQPTTYTASAPGALNLYAWVKDAAGNISPPFSPAAITITLNRTLDVSIVGTGSGRVYSSPGGIDCLYGMAGIPGTCSTVFSSVTPVGLLASPEWNSIFSGWGGDCSGVDCSFAPIASNRSVTATFSPKLRAKVGGNEFATIKSAYTVVPDTGGDLLLQESTFEEKLLLNLDKTVNIKGGTNSLYTDQSDRYTLIIGSLKISKGRIDQHQTTAATTVKVI